MDVDTLVLMAVLVATDMDVLVDCKAAIEGWTLKTEATRVLTVPCVAVS